MHPAKPFSIFLIVLFALPVFARQNSSSAPTVQITGEVLSLSANILDIKPASSPAVWVTIPADLQVDRNALKQGASVSVRANWAQVCYVATSVTVQK